LAAHRTQSLLAGRYRLLERIAAGGTGEVWRAGDEVLGREVAVKMLRQEYAGHAETLARFEAEARHAGRLAHPGIVRVYDYGQDRQAGAPFLVMELVDGPSLATVLAGGPLPPPRVLEMIAQVAAGLAAAHAAGLVHRDIKPANLLLAPGGTVKITDFGIASAAGSAPITQSGMLACTPGYLAPERAQGFPAGPAGDLYSLGIVAWEALTGTPPFTGTPLEVALAHVNRDLPPLPASVPAGLAALVAAMTARNPAERPDSAAVVAQAGQLRAAWPAASMAQPHQGGETAQSSITMVLAGIPGHEGPSADGRRRAILGKPILSRHRPAVLLTLAGLAAAGGLAAIVAAATPGTASRPPVAAPRSAVPAASTVLVDAATLEGQPAATVLVKLRQAGLRPRVVRRPDGHQPPGTVIAVAPSGQVTVGATVTVTVAISPPGHTHHGDGHGNNGNNGGGGGGDGGGGDGGGGGGGDGH
jgi:eukaryotic-like serine/threonine-protein kinase